MKKNTQTIQTEEIPCFECEHGTLQPISEDYSGKHSQLGDYVVPNTPILRCDDCSHAVIGEDGNSHIDEFLNSALNVISPEEIQALLTKYNLTQKRASQITGLGEKNISRWLSGRSLPSASVSNLLRLVLADVSAFERLKQRSFGNETPVSYPLEERQPDSTERDVLKCVDYAKLVKIGVVRNIRSPKERRSELCVLGQCEDLNAFGSLMDDRLQAMAAFKDTKQKCNPISGGLWVWLGEQAARHIRTESYDRKKLHKAVKELRQLTQHPLTEVASEVQQILAKAGVALVFVPAMKESALRGCTRMLTHNKALIIHSLKFRSLSQFWIVLFHEIAHLLLHITEPGEIFAEYETRLDDQRELDADTWAYDTLVSLDRELEFKSNFPDLKIWQIKEFATQLRVHPSIIAEILNLRAGKELISYSYLNKAKLSPRLSESETKALMATSVITS